MTDIRILFSTNIVQALKGANAPSAGNPFATIADLSGLAAWGLNGNSNGVEKYIGTNDAFDFPIVTNNVEVARFLKTGEFGIGVVAPIFKTEITGSSNGTIGLSLSNTDVTGVSQFILSESAGTGSINFYIQKNNSGTTPGTENGVEIINTEASYMLFGTNGNERLRILSTGEIGVNTSTPSALLTVVGVNHTSANYSLEIQDDILNNLFSVKNNSHINIGNGTPLYDDYLNIAKSDPSAVGISITNNNSGAVSILNLGEDISNRFNFLYFNSGVGGNYSTELPVPNANLCNIRSVAGGDVNTGNFVIGGGAIYNYVRSGLATFLDPTGFRIDLPTNMNVANANTFAVSVGNSYFGGNASASARVHVVGIDATIANFVFKAQNSSLSDLFAIYNSGQIKAGDGNVGLFMGVGSGTSITTALYSTAFGSSALQSLVDGNYNSAFGLSSLGSCNSGGRNSGFGFVSLGGVTSGFGNTGIGWAAAASITNGGYVTAIGIAALEFSTSSENTAVGGNAFTSQVAGSGLTSVGVYSWELQTAGDDNTGLGRAVGRRNGTGSRNTFMGSSSGYYNVGAGSDNIFIGYQAGYFANDTGGSGGTIGTVRNIFIGNNAGQASTSNDSIFIGYLAGQFEVNDNRFIVANNTNTFLYGVISAVIGENQLGLGTVTPDSVSILDVQSTTRGVRFPNMTTAQRTAITPSESLLVYDTDIHQYFYYDGTNWLGM